MATWAQTTDHNKNYTLQLIVNEDSYSIDNNTSEVSYTLNFITTSAGYSGTVYNIDLSINGSTIIAESGVSHNFSSHNTTYQLASGTMSVSHNDDGSKTIGVYARIKTPTGASYSPGLAEISNSLVLTTIPRSSAVSVPDAYIGSATTITLNRASSSFTHTLRYAFGSLTGTIATGVGDSYGWTIPTSFYTQIPTSSYGIGIVYADTYNNGTLVGTKSTNFTAYVSEALNKPSVSITTIDTNEDTILLTGNNKAIVKGHSIVSNTWSSSPKNSASITKNTINGVNVSESPYVVSNPQTNQFTLTATDSRGFTNSTYDDDTELIDYVELGMDGSCYRKEPTSSDLYCTFTGNYFNDTFGSVSNTLDLSYKYRIKDSGTSWDDITATSLVLNTDYTISGNTFYSGTGTSASEIQLTGEFIYTNIYEVAFFYEDKLVDSYTIKTIPKGKPMWWWNEDGMYRGSDNAKYVTVDDIYPVGSIYMSINSTSPATLFGGTWEQIKGRFLLGTGANDANTTDYWGNMDAGQYDAPAGQKGGECKHQLTTDEMPSHNHMSRNYSHNYNAGVTIPSGHSYAKNYGGTEGTWGYANSDISESEISDMAETSDTGNNQSHNNMPPYLAVYMWQRTA